MTHQIDNLPTEIMLGRQGEKGANSVLFDVTDWVKLYPAGDFSITYTRQGETAVYPESADSLGVETTTDDGVDTTILTWTPSEAVLDIAGKGTAVIHCAEGGVEKRSAMTSTQVEAGHGAAGTAPDPLADYTAKWGSVDISVSALSEGTAPTASIAQDETGTSISLGIPKGDTGPQGPKGDPGEVLFATLNIDTATGDLVMTTPDAYTGPTFLLNESTGDLEVTI